MKSAMRSYIIEELGIPEEDVIDTLIAAYREALDEHIEKIGAAIRSGVFSDMTFCAHALKGCSAYIGAEPIRAVCLLMEQAAKQADGNGYKNGYNEILSLRDAFDREA